MDAKEALERLYPAMQDAHVQRSKFYAPRGPVKTEADADNDLDLEALAVLRAVVDERDALKAEVERLQVQLAGCSTAALGWNEKSAKQGDYGWSAPYQDVLDLRQRCEKAEAELAAARPLLDAAKNTEHITDEYGSSAWRGITELKREALAYRAGRDK
jgi:hypothetical protein